MVAWIIPKQWTVWPRPGFVFGGVTAGVLLFLLIFTEAQLQYWRNSVTLFSHTVEVTGDSIIARYNLAEALAERGDEERAIEHYRKALRYGPTASRRVHNSQVQAHFNLGVIYRAHEKWANAESAISSLPSGRPGQRTRAPQPGTRALPPGQEQVSAALRRFTGFSKKHKLLAQPVETHGIRGWL